MANAFLEERISVLIEYGSDWGDQTSVDINTFANGNEHRRLVNPFLKRVFNISFDSTPDEFYTTCANLWFRCFGMYAGFRAKALDDYTTNGYIGTPTAFDQTLEVITAGSLYQLQKRYGTDQNGLSIGYPIRTIYKPVASTTKIGIVNSATNFEQTVTTHWSVDTTTGRVTFAANKTKSITGITTGATTLISFGSSHTFLVGDSVHFSSIVGTTQLNGKRGVITAINTAGDNITVSIDSTGYTAWSSGGTVNTRPQTGETVKGGCEFDIPVRFNSDLKIGQEDWGRRRVSSIQLIELVTP